MLNFFVQNMEKCPGSRGTTSDGNVFRNRPSSKKKKKESTEMIKTYHPGIKGEHISCLFPEDDDILTENKDFTPLGSHIFIPCTLVSEKKEEQLVLILRVSYMIVLSKLAHQNATHNKWSRKLKNKR